MMSLFDPERSLARFESRRWPANMDLIEAGIAAVVPTGHMLHESVVE
jgi:hypothetical protein